MVAVKFSTKFVNTCKLDATSGVLIASPGWWLMPLSQRVKSMPTGHISAMAMASWPAPESSFKGLIFAACVAWVSALINVLLQITAGALWLISVLRLS